MAKTAAQPAIQWQAKKLEKIQVIRLAVAAIFALAAGSGLTIYARFSAGSPSVIASLLAFAEANPPGSMVVFVVGRDAFESLCKASPAILAGAVAFFIGLWRSKRFAVWAHDTLLASFNTDALQPVAVAKAFDPFWGGAPDGKQSLGTFWPDPIGSPRDRAWNDLLAWARRDIGDGARPALWWRKRYLFEPVTWALLTGRPGAGKTRLAMELARSLARRELLGDTARPADPDAQERNAKRLRRAAWRRRVWPTAKRHQDDPWEAGWVVARQSTGAVPSWLDRPKMNDLALAKLKAWRPRMPTILLLDDPRKDDATNVIKLLHGMGEHYAYPVRLLITSQSIPLDLDLDGEWTGESQVWHSDVAGFSGTVVILTAAQALSEPEIRQVGGHMLLPARNWRNTDDEIRRVRHVTGANPYLVEAAFDWLRQDGLLSQLTRQALIEHRAARIVAALEAAGIGTRPHLEALAVATLAGGERLAEFARRAAVLPKPGPNEAALSFPPTALARVFSLDPAQVDSLPPVRPALLGDGFIRYILHQAVDDPGMAGRIARAAWQANPYATLNAARRLVRAGDAIGAALGLIPPAETGLPPENIALILLESAIQVPREEWDDRDVNDGSVALEAALDAIATLTPDAALELVPRLVALMEVQNAVTVVRGGASLACFAALTARTGQATGVWRDASQRQAALDALIRFVEQLKRWGYNEAGTSADIIAAPASLLRCLSAFDVLDPFGNVIERLLDALTGMAWSSRRLLAALLDAVAIALETLGEDGTVSIQVTVRRERIKAEAAALDGGVAKAEKAARQISALAAAITDGRIPFDCAIDVATGLTAVVNAARRHFDISMAVAARQGIEAIEARNATADASIGRALCRALGWEAFLASVNNDFDTCNAAVARVQAATSGGRFGDAGLGFLSFSVAALVWASRGDRGQSADELLDQLEVLAESGATNRKIVLINWLEAESYVKPYEIAKRAAQIDAVVARFAGERWIELLRLRLRSNEMINLSGERLGRVMAAFRELRALAVGQFGVDGEFVMFLLQGLATVANACINSNQWIELERTIGELERWPIGTLELELARSLTMADVFVCGAQKHYGSHKSVLAVEAATLALDHVAQARRYASRIELADVVVKLQILALVEIRALGILTLSSALLESIEDYRRSREELTTKLGQFESIADPDDRRPEARARLQQADDYIRSLQKSAAVKS